MKSLFAILILLLLCVTASPGHGTEEDVPIAIQADLLHHDEKAQTTTATGNVSIKYRDVEVRAERLELDEEKEEARLAGSVKIIAKSQVFQCEEVIFNLKNSRWTIGESKGEISPSFFEPGSVVEPVYVRGKHAEGDAVQIRVSDGVTTTCDLIRPHYSIRARRIIVIPNDKLIARQASFYVGERKIVSVRSFTISMRPTGRRRIPLLPVVGQNELEGYFLKTSYEYMATKSQLGTLYLDFMEKRGTGVGAQQDYRSSNHTGSAYVYYLQDRRNQSTELDARINHRQMLPADFVAEFSLNASQNNVFNSNSDMVNTDLTFRRDVERSNLSLSLHDQRSHTDFSQSTSHSATLQLTQQLSQSTTVNVVEDYRYFDYTPDQAPDQELNSRVEITQKGKWLDWIFRMEQREDLDGGDFTGDDLNYFLERAPEVILHTDSARTKHEIFGMFPAKMDFGFGKFKEEPDDLSLFRANLKLDLENYEKKYGEDTTLSLGGAFQQSFYSDNTAQYVVNYRSELRHNLDSHWSSTLSYSKQTPSGFTPFRFDYYRGFDSLDNTWTYNLRDEIRFNLTSGYDLAQNLYRDAIIRFQLMPNQTYYFSLSTGYDLNSHEFRDVVNRLKLMSGKSLNFNLTTRYSPLTSELSRANAYLDWRFARQWGVQALSGYNGFVNDFDYNQVKLRRSFHDWNTYLTYDQQRREVRFDIALKAFPFFDTRFGVGQSGELLDTSSGEVY